MAESAQLSEAKRALLERYLRGDLPPIARDSGAVIRPARAEVVDQRVRAVEFQVGGSKRPFFFLHGHWKGSPYYCFPLAQELGIDQPFYGLEPYQFDGLSVPPTIETIAAAHLKLMRSIQSEGPYLLGGWCNGGLIAYEIARQLHAAGQAVDLLVLIDPMYLGYHARRRLLHRVMSRLFDLMELSPDKQLDWFLRLLHVCKPLQYTRHLRYVLVRLRRARNGSSQESIRLILDELISWARRKAMRSIQWFARILKLGHARDERHVSFPRLDLLISPVEDLRQDYLGILEWLDMGYMPSSRYPGKITFIWPREEPWHTISAGWRKMAEAKGAQAAEVYIILGNQRTWKTENLHILAEHLKMSLSKAQKEVM